MIISMWLLMLFSFSINSMQLVMLTELKLYLTQNIPLRQSLIRTPNVTNSYANEAYSDQVSFCFFFEVQVCYPLWLVSPSCDVWKTGFLCIFLAVTEEVSPQMVITAISTVLILSLTKWKRWTVGGRQMGNSCRGKLRMKRITCVQLESAKCSGRK